MSKKMHSTRLVSRIGMSAAVFGVGVFALGVLALAPAADASSHAQGTSSAGLAADPAPLVGGGPDW